jgi:pyrroline-5-carboxylate reductase
MKIGFFGCGNMGRAIAEGIRKNDSIVELYFYTPSQIKAHALSVELFGFHVEQPEYMPKDLDWVILAFKPQQLKDFAFDFAPENKILSVLAGVSIEKLSSRFNVKTIARLMPNTPSSLGMGANLLYASAEVETLKKLLSPLGKLFVMETEEQLDKLTAFSGSGPALIFEFARLFEANLKAMSDHPEAREIINQTFLGSSELMIEAAKRGTSLETLREQVTSKKGVTFEALQVMEKKSLATIMEEAFKAAYKRTLELNKE